MLFGFLQNNTRIMIDIQFEEQYTLISVLDTQPIEELPGEIEQAVRENLEQANSNFIIYMETLLSAPENWAGFFRALAGIINGHNGILVIAAAPEILEERLQEMNVITTPTLDEANDYVFMEEIEKNFFKDEDEEE